jgi:integrase/recombinase XerC
MRIAERRLAALLRQIDERRDSAEPGSVATSKVQSVRIAADRFLKSHGAVDAGGKYTKYDIEYSSYRKYRTKVNLFCSFCSREGIADLEDVNLDVLEDYRRSRNISQVTWKVELQALRTFFAYCVQHKWITSNPAKEMKSPRNLKPNEVVPYSLKEEAEIFDACERIGGATYKRTAAVYERLRAKAMILLLRHTALRISDVATLKQSAVTWDPECKRWRVIVRTQKSGEPVFLPIPEIVKRALDLVPLPRNAPQDCPYYFWNGVASQRAVVGIAERSLAAVFKKSGVKDAHAHRYRHTLATRLLENGASFHEVADVLGNTEAVVRKHYGKWSKMRQSNIDRLMIAHFDTAEVRAKVTHESHEN